MTPRSTEVHGRPKDPRLELSELVPGRSATRSGHQYCRNISPSFPILLPQTTALPWYLSRTHESSLWWYSVSPHLSRSRSLAIIPIFCCRLASLFKMARIYADVNQQMPQAYWDYDSVNIPWGVLDNYEVLRKIGKSRDILRLEFASISKAGTNKIWCRTWKILGCLWRRQQH